MVIGASGVQGLLFRGLSTRILVNGLQSMLFTVVWRYIAGGGLGRKGAGGGDSGGGGGGGSSSGDDLISAGPGVARDLAEGSGDEANDADATTTQS